MKTLFELTTNFVWTRLSCCKSLNNKKIFLHKKIFYLMLATRHLWVSNVHDCLKRFITIQEYKANLSCTTIL